MYHDPHVASRHVMILGMFNIHEVCVGRPEQLCCVIRHREGCRIVVFEPGVVPPLAEEDIHGEFL